jgi:hypothetical protein
MCFYQIESELSMKKDAINFVVIVALICPLFAGCGFFVDGEKMAKEVCECSKRADHYKTQNVRQKVLNECVELMIEYEEKLKNNTEELEAYNDYFPCH